MSAATIEVTTPDGVANGYLAQPEDGESHPDEECTKSKASVTNSGSAMVQGAGRVTSFRYERRSGGNPDHLRVPGTLVLGDSGPSATPAG